MSTLQKQLIAAQSRLAEIGDELEAIGQVAETEGRDLNEDDNKNIELRNKEFDTVSNQIKGLQAAVDVKAKIEARRITPELLKLQDSNGQSQNGLSPKNSLLPVKIKSTRSKVYRDTYDAYCVGQWLAATIMHREESRQWCREHGVGGYQNAMVEGTDSLGGYAVPTPMAATIIELMETYGVFRANARNVTMTSETLDVPSLSAGATVYYPSEGASITASDLTFAQVKLTCVKYAQLSLLSTELNEDSVISMVDILTRDFARNFAASEDTNSFIGDGTGTYGGITGVQNKVAAGAIVTTAVGADKWGAVTLANLIDMAARVKEYPGMSPKWYIHRYGYYTAVLDLLLAAGGTDIRQQEEGGNMMLLGYPVVFTQVLAGQAAATGDMLCAFGDLDLGAYLGTRRQVSVRTLNELYAATDQIGVLATLRSDTQIHSLGTATEAGAIVIMEAGADA